MVELLLRLETVLLEVSIAKLIIVGCPVLLVGLLLWLSGDRFSSAIIGVLGAAVGAVCGLLVSQWLTLDLWISMIVGAVILAGVSIWLRNILIIILATLVFAMLGGGGYLTLKLDSLAQQSPDTGDPNTASVSPSFLRMDLQGRQAYVAALDATEPGSAPKAKAQALLTDLWQTVEPYVWPLVLATLVGGAVALVLIKFIKSVVILVAYSSVGTSATGLGLLALCTSVGLRPISQMSVNRWILPASFTVMIAIGCFSQIRLKHRKTPATGGTPAK
jgi:hypothetical protein